MSKQNKSKAGKQNLNNSANLPVKSFWNPRNIVIAVLVVVIIAGLVYNFFIRKTEPQFVKQGEVTFINNGTKAAIRKIDVELAITPDKQAQGLMYRSHMADSLGMLFIMPSVSKHAFWMKNTLIPLDIAFIDSIGRIDTIYRDAAPLSERSLPSRRRVQFVIEVNSGFCNKNGIKEGDLISYRVMNYK